jgi:hypothetical protein
MQWLRDLGCAVAFLAGVIVGAFALAILLVGVAVHGGDEQPQKLQSGLTHWGELQVVQDAVTINGNKGWTASGTIQRNGEIHLLWKNQKDDGSEAYALGVYRFDEGRLNGRWGWFATVSRGDDGKIRGADFHETILVAPYESPPLR